MTASRRRLFVRLRPPSYGGKTRAGRTTALLPPHEHHVEPFAGSLAVLPAKAADRLWSPNGHIPRSSTAACFWAVHKRLRPNPDRTVDSDKAQPRSTAAMGTAA